MGLITSLFRSTPTPVVRPPSPFRTVTGSPRLRYPRVSRIRYFRTIEVDLKFSTESLGVSGPCLVGVPTPVTSLVDYPVTSCFGTPPPSVSLGVNTITNHFGTYVLVGKLVSGGGHTL